MQRYSLSVVYRFAAVCGCWLLTCQTTTIAEDLFSGKELTAPNMVHGRGPKENWGITEGKGHRILNLTEDSEKPVGQWNEMVTECFEDQVKVWVNGDLVNRHIALLNYSIRHQNEESHQC